LRNELPEIVRRLEARYGEVPEIEPRDAMDELICCILSQHTSDANSFPAFDRLKAELPNWEGVLAAGPLRVADIVRTAGLANQKAKSIDACLRAIYDRTGGFSIDHLKAMPMREAREWLEQLPGVGPKTASIVLCFAFGMGAIPVDTHVFRVGWRLGFYDEKIGADKAHDVLLKIVPPEWALRFHVALIRHGRGACSAPLPKCEICPITEFCGWFQAGGPAKRREEMRSKRSGRAKLVASGTLRGR